MWVVRRSVSAALSLSGLVVAQEGCELTNADAGKTVRLLATATIHGQIVKSYSRKIAVRRV